MTTKLYVLKEQDGEVEEWAKIPVYNRSESDERLDEQFDTGSIMTISDTEEPFEEYTLFKVVVFDGSEETENFYFGFDTVEKRGEGYFIHTIELVELTRWAMGLFIDGKRITQPITGTRKTLMNAYVAILRTAKLCKGTSDIPFFNGNDDEINRIMQDTVSPEFYWTAGTSFWECLVDIGNVINCIPRITYNVDTKHFNVKFEKVNEITGIYEL